MIARHAAVADLAGVVRILAGIVGFADSGALELQTKLELITSRGDDRIYVLSWTSSSPLSAMIAVGLKITGFL